MRRLVRSAFLAGAALTAACFVHLGSGGSSGAPPEATLRLWIDPLVRWEAGASRHVDIAIENGTTRTVSLGEPTPSLARVAVFLADLRVCGVEPRPGPADPRPPVSLPPGGSLSFRVDLGEACANVPPGEYRFEVDYRSPPVESGGTPFTGAFATRYGVLDVEGSPAGAEAERSSSPRARAARTPPRR